MSLNRFSFITRFIQFDDRSTREERKMYDKFACFRDFFEKANENNAKWRYPSPYLAIDETLYPYRGQIGFKQYNPSKPVKYSLLYRSLCDSSVQYTYYSLPYAGKPDDLTGDAGKYYITSTDQYSKYLVENFNKLNSIKSCNVSVDRYFTSITLADWATSHNFSIVGTMRLDRNGIPKEIKTLDGRQEKSTLYAYQKDGEAMLVFYVDKEKSGKRNVVVLTTMHNSVSVTKDQRVKPNVHTFYDHTKGGVDVVNLVSSHNTTKMKTRKWLVNALAFILDTVCTNAKAIISESQSPVIQSSFDFTYNLAKSLVLPSIQRRYHNSTGLSSNIIGKMCLVLGIPVAIQQPAARPAPNVGRCCICVEAITGTDNYKAMRERLNNKLKSKCKKCSEIVCKQHMESVCSSCYNA